MGYNYDTNMNTTNLTSEKRIKIVAGILGFAFLFLVYHIASVMSVAPAFFDTKIASAPREDPMTTLSLIEFMKHRRSK